MTDGPGSLSVFVSPFPLSLYLIPFGGWRAIEWAAREDGEKMNENEQKKKRKKRYLIFMHSITKKTESKHFIRE